MQEIEYRMNQHNDELDVIIVGAGFSGLYMLYKMRKMNLKALIIERASDAGGTWFWNRYPGARCDIESIEYSYSFSDELQQEWNWSNRYSDQSEILEYINYVVKKFNLKENIVFNTSVKSATFDENLKNWILETDSKSYSSKFCVMATGTLSSIKQPNFDGLENFKGDWYHTGNWPHEGVDFKGKRVGQIGTGSTGIQTAPIIAETASHLTVFQRNPNFSVPASNRPLNSDFQKYLRENREKIKKMIQSNTNGHPFLFSECKIFDVSEEEREEIFERAWENGGLSFRGCFQDIAFDKKETTVPISIMKFDALLPIVIGSK